MLWVLSVLGQLFSHIVSRHLQEVHLTFMLSEASLSTEGLSEASMAAFRHVLYTGCASVGLEEAAEWGDEAAPVRLAFQYVPSAVVSSDERQRVANDLRPILTSLFEPWLDNEIIDIELPDDTWIRGD